LATLYVIRHPVTDRRSGGSLFSSVDHDAPAGSVSKSQVGDSDFPWIHPRLADNNAHVSDPVFRAPYEEICQTVGYDDAMVNVILKEVAKQSLASTYVAWLPAHEGCSFLWPWVRNSYDAWRWGGYYAANDQLQYLWLDKTVKESMSY
jgi:hypothetical protein